MQTYRQMIEQHEREKREYWQSLLATTRGNVTLAAELAGCTREYVHRVLKQLNVERPRYGAGAWKGLRVAREHITIE